MHNTSNPEADGLQQQKTTPCAALSAKNRKRRIQFAQTHQNWTIEDWKSVAWSEESWFLLRHSDGRVRIWCKEHESMDPSCLVSTVQAAGGGVMVWGIFSWHTLGPLVPIEHRLNATAYLSIVADHVHPFMTTVYHLLMATSSSIMHMSQSSNHLRLVSWTWQWVNFTQMASTVTRSQSNRAPLGCDGTGDSHHGCTADKSAATAWCYHVNMDKISEACFQHLVESIPWRIKAVLKAKKKWRKWRDIRPSMVLVTHTLNLCSAF